MVCCKSLFKRNIFLLLFVLLSIQVFVAYADNDSLEEIVPIGDNRYSCSYHGVKHDFIVDLPESAEGSPLIVVLHGYGSTAAAFRQNTGLEKDAVPRGYTVVYVTGAAPPGDRTASTGWNYGNNAPGNDDLGFLSALARSVQKQYRTDETRIFAVGFSNGAFMAHRLALEANDTFSAVVCVAGSMSEPVWKSRPETCSVGVLQITGEKDNVIPKHCDGSADTSKMPAVEDVIDYYTAANGMEPIVETEKTENGSLLVKYRGSSSDRQVWHLLVKDGRHSWSSERVTGINTNQLILDYLMTQ